MADAPALETFLHVSRKRTRLIVVGCIIGCILFKMSFVLFFIGMLPSMIAYIVDVDPRKYLSSTVAALNLAGVFPYAMEVFWRHGMLDAVLSVLANPFCLLIIYGSAAAGWALVHISPLFASMMLDGLYKGRIAQLETLQKKAIEDWGNEVKGAEG